MRATLFHHPSAGQHETDAESLLTLLAETGIYCGYCSLEDDEWHKALKGRNELVLVAGGDGTVAKVATALPDRSVPIAILPTGSGNNVARSLGAFGKLSEVIRGLQTARTTQVHSMCVQSSFGRRRAIESIGLGPLARSVKALEAAQLDGREKLERGRMALREALELAAPLRVQLQADEQPIEDRLLMLEVMSLPMIGPNLQIGPKGSVEERRLSVVYLAEDGRDAMLDWLCDPDGEPAPMLNVRSRSVELRANDEVLRVGDKTVPWDGAPVSIWRDPVPLTFLIPGLTP